MSNIWVDVPLFQDHDLSHELKHDDRTETESFDVGKQLEASLLDMLLNAFSYFEYFSLSLVISNNHSTAQ